MMRELFMGLVNEDELIDETSEPTTNKWSSPVDPVVFPGPANKGWSKLNGWVH